MAVLLGVKDLKPAVIFLVCNAHLYEVTTDIF